MLVCGPVCTTPQHLHPKHAQMGSPCGLRAGAVNASNPYNIGAIEAVIFNNLRCPMINAGQLAVQPAQQALASGVAASPAKEATDVQVGAGLRVAAGKWLRGMRGAAPLGKSRAQRDLKSACPHVCFNCPPQHV